MKDLVGQHVGNYRLIRLLGRGGFAEVYLGQHMRLNMQTAIKVLHTHLANEDIEEFQREAEIIASLVHPNIVRILDFDVKDGTPFLVMDYAPHGTLSQKYPRGTHVSLPEVVTAITQIAQALQYAHEQKLIHRDIKPENMLIGRRNEIVSHFRKRKRGKLSLLRLHPYPYYHHKKRHDIRIQVILKE